jgi:hypothetical protein
MAYYYCNPASRAYTVPFRTKNILEGPERKTAISHLLFEYANLVIAWMMQ